MKKWATVMIFFLALAFSPVRVFAQSENEFLPSGTEINSDYIRLANVVQIDGEVHGDAFLVGGVVIVNGKIDGDLFVFGGKVTVNGLVGNSIRIIGGDVTINSTVGRNTLLVCGNCLVTKQASISGSLLAAAGNLELSAGAIGKGFRFFGNRLYLNSEIANEAFVVSQQQFVLGPNASISGDLKYTGANQAVLSQGATVSGSITYEKNNPEGDFPRFFGAKSIFDLRDRLTPVVNFGFLIIALLIGFLLMGIFPRWFEKSVQAMEKKPAASFGLGLISIVTVPVVSVLLAVTLVGIPVSIVAILIGYSLYVLAGFIAAFFIGRILLVRFLGERRGWALTVGLVIFYILGFFPYIGQLLRLLVTTYAIGGIVLSYRHPEIYNTEHLDQLSKMSEFKNVKVFQKSRKLRKQKKTPKN
jgi:cytoskeletal protein CcmA (bactofilin family)